jgi:hypothetical protein
LVGTERILRAIHLNSLNKIQTHVRKRTCALQKLDRATCRRTQNNACFSKGNIARMKCLPQGAREPPDLTCPYF